MANYDEALNEEEVRTTAPLIAIEILSPDDRINRVVVRLKDFLTMGIAHVWLLDPIERVGFTFSHAGLKLVEEPTITIPESPIFLDLRRLSLRWIDSSATRVASVDASCATTECANGAKP